MPFKSEKQRKWMWANNPDMARKWTAEEKNEAHHEESDLDDGSSDVWKKLFDYDNHSIQESKLRQIIREAITYLA
jgi:hypothetical protein